MSLNSKPPGDAKPDRRQFLRLASLSALAPALSSSAEVDAQARDQNPSSPAHPNIIIVMADQHQTGLTKRSGFPLDTMVDFLEGKGIRENTVIVYLSDHGDYSAFPVRS